MIHSGQQNRLPDGSFPNYGCSGSDTCNGKGLVAAAAACGAIGLVSAKYLRDRMN
jgi:hypothetical protein